MHIENIQTKCSKSGAAERVPELWSWTDRSIFVQVSGMLLLTFLLVLIRGVQAQSNPCALLAGTIQGDTPKLEGCEFAFSVEFCPVLRKSATNAWVNSATLIVTSKATKNAYISPCGTRTKVFATFRNDEFKLAKDLSKDLNMTTGESVYTATVLYTTFAKPMEAAESFQNVSFFLRWIKDQNDELVCSSTLQHDQQSNLIRILDVSPNIQNSSHIQHLVKAKQLFPSIIPTTVAAAAADSKSSAVATATDVSKFTTQECNLDHLTPGQWQYNVPKETWEWKPHLCQLDMVKRHGFLRWAKQYKLKTVVFIGAQSNKV